MTKVRVRKGMPSVALSKAEFTERFKARFYDPVFAANGQRDRDAAAQGLDLLSRLSQGPRTRKAGKGFADPVLRSLGRMARGAPGDQGGRARSSDPASPSRILIINGSMRSDQTCPGEMSKTWRLVEHGARSVIEAKRGFEVDVLDLSRLTSEYGRVIYPCKACVSTAMPLCHWPCSCYPNHAIGQVNDWMNEIYPMWVAAHGIMIVTPVNWYQAPAALKAMIDRLVCADGGNPDPTSTHGKDAGGGEGARAQRLALSAPSRRAPLFGRRAWRCVGRRKSAAHPDRLAHRHGTDPGRAARRCSTAISAITATYATSHDDLDARPGFSGRGPQCRACAHRGGHAQAQGQARRRPMPGSRIAATKITLTSHRCSDSLPP